MEITPRRDGSILTKDGQGPRTARTLCGPSRDSNARSRWRRAADDGEGGQQLLHLD